MKRSYGTGRDDAERLQPGRPPWSTSTLLGAIEPGCQRDARVSGTPNCRLEHVIHTPPPAGGKRRIVEARRRDRPEPVGEGHPFPNTSSGSSITSAEQRGSAHATPTTDSSAPLVAHGSTRIMEARRIPMRETNEQVADSLDSESTVRATPWVLTRVWSEVVTRAVAYVKASRQRAAGELVEAAETSPRSRRPSARARGSRSDRAR
jgi:hypothetical protein